MSSWKRRRRRLWVNRCSRNRIFCERLRAGCIVEHAYSWRILRIRRRRVFSFLSSARLPIAAVHRMLGVFSDFGEDVFLGVCGDRSFVANAYARLLTGSSASSSRRGLQLSGRRTKGQAEKGRLKTCPFVTCFARPRHKASPGPTRLLVLFAKEVFLLSS